MGANPFGLHDFDKAPKGTGDFRFAEPVTFRYRIVVHQGTAKEAKLAEKYAEFTSGK
jgi:hypothetical protein